MGEKSISCLIGARNCINSQKALTAFITTTLWRKCQDSPLYRWGDWGLQKNLIKVTQLNSSRAGFKTSPLSFSRWSSSALHFLTIVPDNTVTVRMNEAKKVKEQGWRDGVGKSMGSVLGSLNGWYVWRIQPELVNKQLKYRNWALESG